MSSTVNVTISLAPFGSIHVELGKIVSEVQAPQASPAREPVYYLDMLNTDTWIFEVRYQIPTPMYEVPQTTQSWPEGVLPLALWCLYTPPLYAPPLES